MKNWLYQVFIHRTTNECYRGSLNYVSLGSRILDVGIGNGIMLEAFHPLIRSKRLRITGIDVDAEYLKHCQTLIQKHRLEEYLDVCQEAAESYSPGQEGGFDFVLFCMSFMLLKNPRAVLTRARAWLKPGGEIVFVQALFRRRSRLVDLIKPKLKYLTTVDFGRAIYERDFLALLQENGLSIREDRVLKGEWLNSQCRMIVAAFQPAPLPPVGAEVSRRIVENGRSAGKETYPANTQSTSL
jgi:2-polyprenyl-3-methyl-5-hydroxy-6-metoxy-1,4-benzoquinol methylase